MSLLVVSKALVVGSVVKLNSGSPDMEVTLVSSDYGDATVKWVDGNGLLVSAVFPVACVRLAKPTTGSSVIVNGRDFTSYNSAASYIESSERLLGIKRSSATISKEISRFVRSSRDSYSMYGKYDIKKVGTV